MNSFELKKHLAAAIYLIRTNTAAVWLLVFGGLFNTLPVMIENESAGIISLLAICLSMAIPAIVYGMYFEILKNTYSSIPEICSRYLPRYIWLLLRMYVPVLFLAGLPIMLSQEVNYTGGYFHLILVSSSLVYLWVIPFYYFSGKQQGAITAGVGFLIRNISNSTPLILVTLLLETAILVIQFSKPQLLASGPLLFAVVDFFVYIIASIIDFALFIILLLILKETNTD